MLNLKTMYGLMELDKYLEVFEHQGMNDMRKTYDECLLGKEDKKTLATISLYWEDIPLNYHLELIIESGSTTEDHFMINFLVGDSVLETERLLVARKSNLKLIAKSWIKEIRLFAYAGISSYLSQKNLSPKEVETRLSQLREMNKMQEGCNLLKNQLKIRIGEELFHFSALAPQSQPLQEARLNRLIYTWYDRFLMLFREGTWVLADSEQEFIVKVPEMEMSITLDEDTLKLPMTFSMALRCEHPTEMNDGECSAQWLWGINYKSEVVYLPIGSWMELGCFEEEEFVSAFGELIEGINSLTGLLELLALEVRSGAKLSSNFIQKEYDSLISRHSLIWIVESGKVYQKFNPLREMRTCPQAPQTPVVPTPSPMVFGKQIGVPQPNNSMCQYPQAPQIPAVPTPSPMASENQIGMPTTHFRSCPQVPHGIHSDYPVGM